MEEGKNVGGARGGGRIRTFAVLVDPKDRKDKKILKAGIALLPASGSGPLFCLRLVSVNDNPT